MKFPNKVTSYRESSLINIPIVIEALTNNNLTPYLLYDKVKKNFETIEDYMDTLDCLFALNTIAYDVDRGIVYVI